MALTDKLSAIGDAIRSRTQKSGLLKLDEMPDEIRSLSTILLKPGEYPDYIRKEVDRVAAEVRAVLKDDSFVSICMSDSHYPADNNTRISAIHALMGMKALTYLIPVDFIAHLGDVGFEGSGSIDVEPLKANLLELLSYIKETLGGSIPLFVCIGNHDSGNYVTTSNNDDMVPGDWLYDKFTALSSSEYSVFSGQQNGGYGYRDFQDDKIRVYILNTSEEIITGGYSNDRGCSDAQLAWLADSLLNLNTKDDCADWGFIVICHYPADYGAARPLSNVLGAYVTGEAITINGRSFNFSGHNNSTFLVQHHGHIHNFLYDKLYRGSTPEQYDGWRVGIPNSQYNRENYYGTFSGVNYSESISYPKTPNTVKDTSFVVNVLNRGDAILYSFAYGAGYDRSISIGAAPKFRINFECNGYTVSDTVPAYVEKDQPLYISLTLVEGREASLTEVSVTMNDIDITSDVVSVDDDGSVTSINIYSVTGQVEVNISAPENLILTSIDGTGALYAGKGYSLDTRISTSDGFTAKPLTGYYLTGNIAMPDGWSRIILKGTSSNKADGYTEPVIMAYRGIQSSVAESTKGMGALLLKNRTHTTDEITGESIIVITPDQMLSESNGSNALMPYSDIACIRISAVYTETPPKCFII